MRSVCLLPCFPDPPRCAGAGLSWAARKNVCKKVVRFLNDPFEVLPRSPQRSLTRFYPVTHALRGWSSPDCATLAQPFPA